MPKAPGSVVRRTAQAANESVGLSGDAIDPIVSGRQIAPGQLRVLAVDPGDKHVGMAMGLAFARDTAVRDDLASTLEIGHIDGLNTIDTVVNAGWVDRLVIEGWRVYPDKAQELVGSECLTAQFIGAVRHIVRKYNRWSQQVEDRVAVELVEQSASVQQVARRNLQRLGVARVSLPSEPHALSAELHWHYNVLGQRGLLGDA